MRGKASWPRGRALRRLPMVKPHRIHAGVLLGPSPLRLWACRSGRRDTNLNVAATYCDHIICLATGVVASARPVEEVCTSDNLSWIYGWSIHVTTTDGVVSVQPARRCVTDNAENPLDLISERIIL